MLTILQLQKEFDKTLKSLSLPIGKRADGGYKDPTSQRCWEARYHVEAAKGNVS